MAKAFDRNIVFLDRAKETTSTLGRGALSLAGAVAGFQPLSGIGWGTGLYGSPQNYSYYTLEEGEEWEVGLGAYYPLGNTWGREEIFDSSVTGAAAAVNKRIDLRGYGTIFLTLPASKLIAASSGNYVGIGVEQPQYELDVSGTTNVGQIRVDAEGADAPFEIKGGSNVEIHWSDGTVQNTSPTGAINTVSGMLSPAGSNRAIQFNNNELYGGSNSLAFRNVGLGTLIVSGNIVSDVAHTGYGRIISIGPAAGASLSGSDQVIIGHDAGEGSGSNSVIIGSAAGSLAQSINNSVILGYQAKARSNSVVVGASNASQQGGANSVGIGYYTLTDSSAPYSVAIGSTAGQNTSGAHTINIGYNASAKGASSVSIGSNSSTLLPSTTGYNYSVAVGAAAGAVDRAIALGYGAQAIQPSGFVVANDSTNSNMILSGMIGEKLNVLNAKLGINQNDPEAMLHTTAKNSTDVPIIIQGTFTQSSDLTRWNNILGDTLARVTNDGNISVVSGNVIVNNSGNFIADSGSITTNGLMSGNFDELRFVSEGSNRIKIGVGGGNSSGEIFDNDSIYIGNFAGSGIQLPSNYNTYVGAQAGAHDSMATQPSGKFQTFIGYYAGNKAIGGNFGSLAGSDYTTFVGHTAGKDASGLNSVAMGASAGISFQGRDGVHIGANAGAYGSGVWQVNIGSSAGGGANSIANYAINMGYGAGILSTGDNTIFIGKYAGTTTNGDDNIEIVTDGANPSIIGVNSNKLHIQNVIVGDTSTKKLAIGNVGASDLSPDATLEVKPNANSDIGFVVQGASSQTANLTEWQNNSETVLASVAADGTISASGAITAATGITLQRNTPAVTTDKLYNVGGVLYFNGSGVNGAGGGGTSYTAGSGLQLNGTTFDALTATTSASGIIQLQDSATDGTTNRAITPNAVYDISGVLAADVASTGTTNAAAITTNTTNIATNVTNIAATGATNAAAAATNATNIATNVTNIAATGATNAAAAATNTTNIASTGATNAANITTVSGLIPSYTASTGLTLVGTQFSTSGTGLFSHIQFGEASGSITAPIRIGNSVGGSDYSIAIGYKALEDIAATTTSNIGIGYSAGDGLENTSQYNTIVGYSAATAASGDSNTYLGPYAGTNQKADNSISIGYNAGYGASGNKNVYIGFQAGRNVSPGSNNIDITIDPDGIEEMDGLDSKLNIYNIIRGDASSKRIAIGNLGTTDYTPDATLEVKPKEHTDIGLIVQGDASHSANLTEWQNSSEGIRAYVAADGSIATSGTVSATGGMVIDENATLEWSDDSVRIGEAGHMGGLRNISIGQYAGKGSNGGDYNIGIGRYGGYSAGGDYNVAVGYKAGYDTHSTSDHNYAIGYEAGRELDGEYNISVGYQAGYEGGGDHNVGISYQAGYGSDGDYNISLGYQAGYSMSATSDYNLCLGRNAGRSCDGDFNIFLGVHAGYDSDGTRNIYIGYQAGFEADPGSNNIEIITNSVYGVKSTLDGLSNKINIENTIMGDTAANKIVIGTGTTAQTANYSPAATLEIKPKETTDTALIVHSSGLSNVLSVYGSNVSVSGRLLGPISAPVLEDTNATVNVALSSGNYHEVELAAAVTKVIFKEGAVGQRFMVRFAQPAGANYTIAWTNVDVDEGGTGGTVSWAAGGTAPTMTATNGKADTYGFIQRTATTFDGFVVGQNI